MSKNKNKNHTDMQTKAILMKLAISDRTNGGVN